MQYRPLVIIGAPRSGTKILRDCLAEANDATAVPFDINHVWRVGAWAAPHDRLNPKSLSPNRREYIRSRIGRLAKSNIVIEKTVSNAVRVPFVNAVFPEAKFVHLVRDGRDVIESIYRQWQSPLQRSYLLRKARILGLRGMPYAGWYVFNLIRNRFKGREGVYYWGVRYPGWAEDLRRLTRLEVVARQWLACRKLATRDLEELGQDRHVTITYDQLVAGEIKHVLEFLDLDSQGPVRFHRENIRHGLTGRWKSLPMEQQKIIKNAIGSLEAEMRS